MREHCIGIILPYARLATGKSLNRWCFGLAKSLVFAEYRTWWFPTSSLVIHERTLADLRCSRLRAQLRNVKGLVCDQGHVSFKLPMQEYPG